MTTQHGQPRGWPFPVALVGLSAPVVHIVGAAVFALVGAFQFVPRCRRRHPAVAECAIRRHRAAVRPATGAAAGASS